MDRSFRRLHWRWLAMCAITATLAGCAPAPVAETDAESGALMAGSAGSAGAEAMAEGQTPAAVPSAGKRSSRASRATPPASRSADARPSEPASPEERADTPSNPDFALVPSRDSDQQGLASWYGPGLHGRLTASGERFDKEELTAAHRSFAFGSRVCVRSAATGRTVVVRINDRGPFAPGRVIDLSQAAAQELGMVGLGIKPVELWQLDEGEEECPETLVTARKAESLKKTQQAKAQTQTQARTRVQAKAPVRPRVQAKAPAPRPNARTAVASRAAPAARPVAKAAAPAAASATAVASAASSSR
ncbi:MULTISPECIES: septal ring lytic transglycosylase RlpA family protein [unclassified Delftia]|uniref:septal ring lytic transglycosylase RlpA family protein n=1 Tax=unclassified Delftia TaxID=2613839 RepID=UPI0011514CA4|nr:MULTISPECIES: septal ring lytic transglycosylase RlpA family protein [unclassified Delftia]MCB4784724.1 septal ring lytic transglycosylase RlpA family protein [Delftia sp. Lp-1]TQL65815.1 rare lipoprotein A [Delftia sp. HK171]